MTGPGDDDADGPSGRSDADANPRVTKTLAFSTNGELVEPTRTSPSAQTLVMSGPPGGMQDDDDEPLDGEASRQVERPETAVLPAKSGATKVFASTKVLAAPRDGGDASGSKEGALPMTRALSGPPVGTASLSVHPAPAPRSAALIGPNQKTLMHAPNETTETGAIAVRAYRDGIVTSVTRQPISPEALRSASVVELPYRSADVIRRIGAYDVLGELGRGGMGVVYRAFSLRLCRPCAIKVLIAGEGATEVELMRFQNEAMLAARLSHPNIVPVFDAGEEGGQFYFVMELVDGLPLDELAADPAQSTDSLVAVIAKSARALAYAHSRGVVHRDVKPENIIVDDVGEPHITDFGIAANVRADVRRATLDGTVMGTPTYMSPEQINGEVAKIGPASDQYSLGASLFHVVAGREPFDDENLMTLLRNVLDMQPPSAADVAAKHSKREVNEDLRVIIDKALEKRAVDRYPSIDALADDLDAYLEDRPINARPVSPAERLRKLVRRNRTAFVIASVVATTLIVIGAAFAALTVFNIEKTSQTVREQDRQAGVEQAAALERAIRVNMLQGRADIVRELVTKLREDPLARGIDVVRVDQSLAYTDRRTRNRVARRLNDPAFVERIATERPQMAPKVAEVKRQGFAGIDANPAPMGRFEYETAAWNTLISDAQTVVKEETIDGEPMLTVLKPIENSADCQVCHGATDEPGYQSNHLRGVLVVRRSRQAVEDRIASNRTTTAIVGGFTASAILLLIFVFARIFGLRFRRRSFGQ